MLIRYGYEIAINCPQPTAMVCLLSVSEDRKADIRVAEQVFTTPIIPTTTYLDTFGNRCRRLVARPGELRRAGSPGRGPARRLPAVSYGQPLLRDRQAEPDGLGPVRQYALRLGACAGGVRFRPSAHQVGLSAGAIDEKRLRRLRGADRRLPRLRASRRCALPMPQHSRALR